ncbi:lipoyl synthase [Platysternon megacephalum]|uniref:RING-type E3 ubiquitin transferase n=1 Tax=Platysternon megacephalum TaxID=55544 RepID=A0A4D9DG51_9SAUR|nr:lipoyl synthase [Platysternon megacephalum]
MASATPSWEMQEEATCSICLEYLAEPVTIDCGHNFCRACITHYSERGEPESGTKFPCPECRAPFEKGKFRPNRQLANIVDNIKQLRLKPGKGQKENLCERHQEKLKLFCEEDGEAICVVCRESRDHRDHTMLPIEEAAHDYKGKVENRRWSITREFKKLHQLLSEEEQLLLWRLAAEERETLQRLQDNITRLSEQSAALINLITELEEKCLQPAAELLQGVKSALIRSQHVKLQPPEAVSPALKNGYKIDLDMRRMLERFTGE